jgi:hypothetical protein
MFGVSSIDIEQQDVRVGFHWLGIVVLGALEMQDASDEDTTGYLS